MYNNLFRFELNLNFIITNNYRSKKGAGGIEKTPYSSGRKFVVV